MGEQDSFEGMLISSALLSQALWTHLRVIGVISDDAARLILDQTLLLLEKRQARPERPEAIAAARAHLEREIAKLPPLS